MKKTLAATAFATLIAIGPSFAGQAEIEAAQSSIEAQIRAFLAGENETAYSYAAPNIKRIFPTLEQFMGMVQDGYQPVWKPQNYAFGEAREESDTRIAQKVMLTGPDGKSYEALYMLELQEDGTFRITGVSLRGTKALGV